MNNFEASFLGQVEYQKAVLIQENLFQIAKRKNLNAIIGVEHPAVMTFGQRFKFVDENPLGLPQVQSSRGGLVTIHSEGQLVIYPVLDLREQNWGVKQYVCKLLKTTQKLLAELRIESQLDDENIGLYTKQGKVAFCGIQIKNGISLHGISLNVRNDLSLFNAISSCGIQGAALDRLQNHDVNLTLEELFNAWVRIFKSELN